MTQEDEARRSAELESSAVKETPDLRANRGRDLNQSLLPDTDLNRDAAKVLQQKHVTAKDLSVGGSARNAFPNSSRPQAQVADGAGSQTTPVDSDAQRAPVAIAALGAALPRAKRNGRRVNFMAAGQCYGMILDTKAAGPTCHGVYVVDYKMVSINITSPWMCSAGSEV